jgi:FkbM family methyltransferase
VTARGEAVAELLERLEVEVVVDVGAHLGQFGRELREHGYAGRIVSFEPVLAVFAALVKTSTAGDPAWEAHRLALGSEDGQRPLNVPRSTDFSSFLEPSAFSLAEFRGLTAVERQELVPVRRLDGVATAYGLAGPRLFLKLDTQGWDLEVLRGAEETLAGVVGVQAELPVRPVYEGMPAAEEIAGHLVGRGFVETASFPVTTDAGGQPIEVDCIMERRAA